MIMQGKKQQFRIESLAALEKSIGDVLTVLGLMPSSYSEVWIAIALSLFSIFFFMPSQHFIGSTNH